MQGPSKAGRLLRVLIVGPSHDLPGGQANHAAELCAKLGSEPRFSVSFLPLNPRAPLGLRFLQQPKYVRTVATSLIYCGRLLASVPLHDVIHIYSASASSFFISSTPAILVAKLFRKKVILNYHSGKADEQLQRWPQTSTFLMKLADVIAVPSGFLVEVFAHYGIPARAIPNHVDIDRFKYRARRPLQPVFLWNRHFDAIYNASCVLRAFALVQRQFPDARLTLAGVGPQRQEAESLARNLKLRNVDFAGHVAPDRMPELFEAADILLNASNVDNMPLSILEAFAAGLPVVTTNAGGIPFIICHERNGLLVPKNDHKALARAALQLLADEKLATKVAVSARKECEKYSWSAVRSAWLRLYSEVAPVRPAMTSR